MQVAFKSQQKNPIYPFPSFLPLRPSLRSFPSVLPFGPSLRSFPSVLPFVPSLRSFSSVLPFGPSLRSFPSFLPFGPYLRSFPSVLPFGPSLQSLGLFCNISTSFSQRFRRKHAADTNTPTVNAPTVTKRGGGIAACRAKDKNG